MERAIVRLFASTTAVVASMLLAVQVSVAGEAYGQFERQLSRCQSADRGSSPEQGPGELPLTIAGATTVSPRVAACIMDAMGDELVVMAAMGDAEGLPDSWPLPYAGLAKLSPAQEKTLAFWFLTMTNGKHDRPLLVYCHHTKCQLSYNAVRRLHAAGHTRVLWMRDGIRGWKSAGLPVTKARLGAGYAAKLYFEAREPGGALEASTSYLSLDGRGLPPGILQPVEQCVEREGMSAFIGPEDVAEGLLENVEGDVRLSHIDALVEQMDGDSFWGSKVVYGACLLKQIDGSIMSSPEYVAGAIRQFVQVDTLFEDQFRIAVERLRANPTKYLRRSGSE